MEDRPILNDSNVPVRDGCGGGCLRLIGLSFLLLMGACYFYEGPLYYYSDPIQATVVAEETRTPVEGAVVIAVWQMAYQKEVIHVEQTVTDAQGRFRMKGLPFTLRKPFSWLDYFDPRLAIYKPGVGMGGAHNKNAYVYGPKNMPLPDGRIMIDPGSTVGGFSRAAKRFVPWNGRVLAVWRAKTPEEEIIQLNAMQSWAFEYKLWPENAPRLWVALADGYNRIPKHLRKDIYDPRRTITEAMQSEEQ